MKKRQDSVLREVASLAGLPFDDLRQRWRELFGAEAPTHNRPHIERRLAYRIQELAYGGLSDWARSRLREISDAQGLDLDALSESQNRERVRKRRSGMPVAGTRFVRDWEGERHEVTVLACGFEFQGRRYKSLSAIARAITGTRWNGPAFFGLRKQAKDGSKDRSES